MPGKLDQTFDKEYSREIDVVQKMKPVFARWAKKVSALMPSGGPFEIGSMCRLCREKCPEGDDYEPYRTFEQRRWLYKNYVYTGMWGCPALRDSTDIFPFWHTREIPGYLPRYLDENEVTLEKHPRTYPGVKPVEMALGFSPFFPGIQAGESADKGELSMGGSDFGFSDENAPLEQQVCNQVRMERYKDSNGKPTNKRAFDDTWTGEFYVNTIRGGVQPSEDPPGPNNQWKLTECYGLNSETAGFSRYLFGDTLPERPDEVKNLQYPSWGFLQVHEIIPGNLTGKYHKRPFGPAMNFGQNPFNFMTMSFFNKLGEVFNKALANAEGGLLMNSPIKWSGFDDFPARKRVGDDFYLVGTHWKKGQTNPELPNPFYYPPYNWQSRLWGRTQTAWNRPGMEHSAGFYHRTDCSPYYMQQREGTGLIDYKAIRNPNNPLGDVEELYAFLMQSTGEEVDGERYFWVSDEDFRKFTVTIRSEDWPGIRNWPTGGWDLEPGIEPMDDDSAADLWQSTVPMRGYLKCHYAWPLLTRLKKKWWGGPDETEPTQTMEYFGFAAAQVAAAAALKIPIVVHSAGGSVLAYVLRLMDASREFDGLFGFIPSPIHIIAVESTVGEHAFQTINSLPLFKGKLQYTQYSARDASGQPNATWGSLINLLLGTLDDTQKGSQGVNPIVKEYINPATGDWTRNYIDYLFPQRGYYDSAKIDTTNDNPPNRDDGQAVMSAMCPLTSMKEFKFSHATLMALLLGQGHLPNVQLPGMPSAQAAAAAMVSARSAGETNFAERELSSPANARVGDACENNFQCLGPDAPECLPLPSGYCSRDCSHGMQYCPDGSDCVLVKRQDQARMRYCLKLCRSSSDCRAGYSCAVVGNTGDKQRVCWPDASSPTTSTTAASTTTTSSAPTTSSTTSRPTSSTTASTSTVSTTSLSTTTSRSTTSVITSTTTSIVPVRLIADWRLTDDFIDYAGAHHGTPKDYVTTNSDGNKPPVIKRKAAQFDGIDDYVLIDYTAADLALRSEITVSAWVKTTKATGRMGVLKRGYNNSGIQHSEYMLEIYNGKVQFGFGEGLYSLTSQANYVVGPSVADGRWHLLTGILRSGVIELYVDGVAQHNPLSPVRKTVNWRGVVTRQLIGAERVNLDYFQGAMRNVKIWDGAITPGEVNHEFLTLRSGEIAAYWSLSSDFRDWRLSHNGTPKDYVTTNGDGNTPPRIVSSAALFDGVDDYVHVEPTSGLGLYGEISISAWVKTGQSSGVMGVVKRGYNAAGPEHAEYLLDIVNGSARIGFGEGKYPNLSLSNSVSAAGVSDNSWHMITGVLRDNTIRLYVDGLPRHDPQNPVTKTVVWSGTVNRQLLGAPRINGNYFSGALRDVKIWPYGLDDKDVQAEYAYTRR